MKIQFIYGLVIILFGTMARAMEPSAETLKRCPSGHTTLKDVPIEYGLFVGPETEKWRKAIENLEFVPGGCVVTDDSPKREVICATCRFAHSISSTRRPEDGSWTRNSTDAKSFPKPFTDLVKSFPVLSSKQETQPVILTQSLSDKLDIQFEGVNYSSRTPTEKIKADINKWLNKRGIKCKFSSHTHKSTLDAAVRDILEWKTEDISTRISLHFEHSDKTSRVSATFYK